ncbi:tyrosine-type recombinase/integrase [Candidatus Latescibacterota bacterium]
MPRQKRFKTRYPGVFYIEGTHSAIGKTEKIFYIRYRKDNKMVEEKAGRQYQDDMTPARASMLRASRLNGQSVTNTEKREEIREITLNDIWEEYRANNSHLKRIKDQEYQYNKHLRRKLGDKNPQEITPLMIDRLRSTLTNKISIHVASHVLHQVIRLFNYGASRRMCKPLDFKIKIPKYDDRKTEDLSPDQLKKLMEVLNEEPDVQVANIMKLALCTGMRKSEMLKLRWDDIDFERSFILIREPKGGVNEKIPLNSSARAIMESHPKRDGSPFIFPGTNGRIRHRNTFARQLRRIKEKARLPENFRPLHGLRHVYASMLASSGKVDMYTLQKLLTHKSPQMTQRYAHLRDDALRKASEVAAGIINVVTATNVD